MLLVLVPALSGCVQQPSHEIKGTQARLKSRVAIVAINGEKPADPYLLLLPAGEYEAEVLYRSYSKDYRCRFQFDAEGGQSYEILRQSNTQPLVLYRWERANALWVMQLDAVEPECRVPAETL